MKSGIGWDKASEFRRRFGIVGYIGANGSGKSLAAVADCLPSLRAGRPVLSAVRLLDWENPRPCELSDSECEWPMHPDHGAAHPLWLPIRTWSDVIDAEHCDVLLDEITGFAGSRDGNALPREAGNTLMQLRRRDLKVRWTAPDWGRADVMIRRITQAVAHCTGHMSQRVAGSGWRANRLTKIRVLDVRDFDELTEGKRNDARALSVGWGWIPRLEAARAYDSLEQVMSLPLVEGGRCPVCAGARPVKKCTCDH